MGQVTPNMGIYVPSAGETNYDQSFAAGQINIDLHDHSGPPNNGVPLSSSGIADFSITRNKLNANVVLAGGGLAVDGGSPNALKVDGVLLGFYNLAGNGIVVKTGAATATVRSITGAADQISVTNGDGVAANPQVGIASNPIIPGTGAITVPIGTTAQRPGTPTDGMIRFNSTLGFLEQYDGGTASWQPIISGDIAGWVLIQSQTASASASIDFTTGITTTYNNYVVVFDNVVPATNGEDLQIRYSIDGGSSYVNSGYSSGSTSLAFGGNSLTSQGTDTAALSLIALNNAANNIGAGKAFLYNLTNGVDATADCYGVNKGSNYLSFGGGFFGNGTGVINAIQMIMSAGNITSGNFHLYGVAQ